MKRVSAAVGLLGAMVLTMPLLTGCGTSAARTGHSDAYAIQPFYPASYIDDQMVGGVLDSTDDRVGAKTVGMFLCGVVDFPFSVTTDTLCLPYDIWAYRRDKE